MPTESTTALRIALGTDHAGFTHKEAVKQMLHLLGHETKDFGASLGRLRGLSGIRKASGRSSRKKLLTLALSLVEAANGEAMAANKIKGVRCALFVGIWKRLSLQKNTTTLM